MITRRLKIAVLALAGLWFAAGAAPALGAETQVAVAANFTEPAKEIAAAFQKATGDTATLSFGASGAFYAQITKGAPFEVLLSADADRPKKAEADGFAVAGSRFTYAIGRLVLFSKTPGLIDTRGGGALTKAAKVAIADPKAAPYGKAAIEAMTNLGVYDQVQPKLVIGSSIAQAYQFVDSGAAEVGFVALSQVANVKGGSRWVVPAKDHSPIEQQAVLLKTGQNNAAARAFMAFLKGPQAVAVIRRYGYETR